MSKRIQNFGPQEKRNDGLVGRYRFFGEIC